MFLQGSSESFAPQGRHFHARVAETDALTDREGITMHRFRRTFVALALVIAASGCASHGVAPTETQVVPNQVRQEIHRLAVRGPLDPRVSLTDELDTKGAASGKWAAGAGLGWLGGTIEAAAEAGVAGPFVFAFGLVTTPIAAASGAIYGAANSDTRQAIDDGNRVLAGALDFAGDRFRRAVELRFGEGVPVDYRFVDDRTDAELVADGFDAVLDIHMDSLVGSPSEDGARVVFEYVNRAELTIFGRPDLAQSNRYGGRIGPRPVSSWAQDDGRRLLSELDAGYEVVAGRMVDDLFLSKAIRVQGLEPVSKGWLAGSISGTLPMFVWSARDGSTDEPGADVEYEVLVYSGSKAPETGTRTKTTRYVPPEALQACTRYRWQVRAHYRSFGQPMASEWSPTYRFKTACAKRG